jgi:hypothetical protein
MANVLNRTTKQYIPSADTPAYPTAQWIHNPDLSAVIGFASKYWTISGDTVSLMNQAARDAVDAAELAAQRDATAAQLDQLENYVRAFALVVLDEFNAHTAKTNSILTAIDGASSYGAMRSAIGGIADLPTRTIANMKTGVRNKLGT